MAGNTNALDLTTEFFDFVPGVSYQMVDQGYEAVPWQLQQRFLAAGGQISFDRWLDGFVGAPLDDGAQGVKLNFRDGSALTARWWCSRCRVGRLSCFAAEGEILGPQNADFRHDLASVSGIPLFKLFLLYKQSWWQAAGVTRGRSLTDLPLRQCYYWPVGSKGTDAPNPDKPGLLMAYDDLMNVGFWDALDTRAGSA